MPEGLKFRILYDPKSGAFQIGSKEGTFEEGEKQIKQLQVILEARGMKLELGGVEQHSHSPDHIHVHMVPPLTTR